ncbi:NXPE family member 4-like [Ptychodera flava]|uniref:NXPE family member 4-like n=1 Tax=Ptychodera flava TaxID=63121 RepID=UPI00396A5D63
MIPSQRLLVYGIPLCVFCLMLTLILFRYSMKTTLQHWVDHPYPSEDVAYQFEAQKAKQIRIAYHENNGRKRQDAKSNSKVIVNQDQAAVRPTVGISTDKAVFSISNTHTVLNMGDIVHFQIDTLDSKGHQRHRGGDFWYATMSTEDRNFRTSGRFLDHGNGSYSLHFYCGFKGLMNINITLVYPAETVNWLNEVYRPSERRVTWKGLFRDGPIGGETTECVIERDDRTKLDQCKYQDTTVLGQTVLVCDKPSELSCDHLTYMESKNMDARVTELLGNKTYLFDKSTLFTPVRSSPDVVSVSDSERKISHTSLPICGPGIFDNTSITSGYWLDDVWHSMVCRNKQYTVDEVKHCLKNKNIYFLGDSTIRQLFLALVGSLGYPGEVHIPDQKLLNLTGFSCHQDHMRMYYALVRHEKENINMTFRFHGLPITGRARYRIKEPNPDVLFEQHILDNLKTENCNYVILISPWAHYVQWTLVSYSERLTLLRESLLRLKRRCSNTVVIVKGSHQRDHRSTDSHIYASDYILQDMNKLLRDVFHDDWIVFLDVWDMNLSFLAPWNRPSNVHMPFEVVKEELNFLFSHICHS